MTTSALHSVDDFTGTLGEGPLWSESEQALYWLDTMQRKIIRVAAPYHTSKIRDLPYRPSSLAFLRDGRLLIAYKKGIGIFDFDRGQNTPIPLTDVDLGVVSFNDNACDRAGRLWIGTRHREATEPVGALYCIEPDMRVRREVEGIIVSNGIAFSPDERTMYHVDSRPGRIDAYNYDGGNGTISDRRVFLDYNGTGRRPDGCTVDAEGFLWVAEIDGWRVARCAADGRLDRIIPLPFRKPSSVAFGGPNMTTLFITSIRFGLTSDEEAAQPLAGQLVYIETDIAGRTEPFFERVTQLSGAGR